MPTFAISYEIGDVPQPSPDVRFNSFEQADNWALLNLPVEAIRFKQGSFAVEKKPSEGDRVTVRCYNNADQTSQYVEFSATVVEVEMTDGMFEESLIVRDDDGNLIEIDGEGNVIVST